MGILIEHFSGAFPLWLSPEQVRILPVSEKFSEYGRGVESELKSHGLRVSGDYRPEKVGYKIREAQLEKIPYMLVVGEREAAEGKVAVRLRSGKDLGAMALETFIKRIRDEAESRKDVAE